jgi:hypothetical protein
MRIIFISGGTGSDRNSAHQTTCCSDCYRSNNMKLTQQVTVAMDYKHFPFHGLASEIKLHGKTGSA